MHWLPQVLAVDQSRFGARIEPWGRRGRSRELHELPCCCWQNPTQLPGKIFFQIINLLSVFSYSSRILFLFSLVLKEILTAEIYCNILLQTTIEDCLERGDTTAHGVEFTSRQTNINIICSFLDHHPRPAQAFNGWKVFLCRPTSDSSSWIPPPRAQRDELVRTHPVRRHSCHLRMSSECVEKSSGGEYS